MFKYIHSVILKGESDDKAKQSDARVPSDGKLICNEEKRIDHWTQMIFPVYLNYASIEDKMVRDGKSKSDASKQNSSNTVDWKAINADNKDKYTAFPIYPPMDPSKNMEWKKLISYSYSHTSKSDNQQTKS